jgi:hypothetical protein
MAEFPTEGHSGARLSPPPRFGSAGAVVTKGGVIFLIPERPVRHYRGLAKGARDTDLREKADRL